jgi:hypothetical protein
LIRRLAGEGVPKARIAARLGISRTTVVKAVASDTPPRYEAADHHSHHRLRTHGQQAGNHLTNPHHPTAQGLPRRPGPFLRWLRRATFHLVARTRVEGQDALAGRGRSTECPERDIPPTSPRGYPTPTLVSRDREPWGWDEPAGPARSGRPSPGGDRPGSR